MTRGLLTLNRLGAMTCVLALHGCFTDTTLEPPSSDSTEAGATGEASESAGESSGDGDSGDGDGSTGDGTSGDGDGTTGDGTTGDGTTGDGDGATGDGDGTSGDGTTGDGDGTSGDGTTGDGDGTTGDGTTGDGTTGDGDGTTGDGTTGDGTTGDGDGTTGDGTTGDGTTGDGDGTTGDGTTGDGTTGDGDGTTGDGTTGDGTTGDGDGTTGDGTTGDGTTGDGDGTTGDGDGDGDGTPLFPARGIDISLVEANQGVGVYIGSGASWVSAAGRLARLIAGRETLIRIHHTVHGDWIPREVEAQLFVQRQDLSTVTYTDRRTIFMDSVASDLSSGFAFELDCAVGDCDAGADYQFSFWDVGAPGPQSPGINLNPSTATAPIGFESLTLEMRLVFVPLEYVPLGTIPDLNTTWMDGIADAIYQMTPTTSVTYEVRPVSQVTSQITTDLIPAWSATGDVYNASFPQPNEFYVGVIDPGINPPLSGLAAVGANYNAIQFVPSPVEFAKSVVHETGHNHGLSHIDCPGFQFPVGSADDNFPTHPTGALESGGWGVLDKLYRPASTHTDYMGYCTPAWTSAYHWGRVLANLESVN